MIKDGYIRIKEKIYFEYYELEKPKIKDYYIDDDFLGHNYSIAMRDYKASKRLVKVSNNYAIHELPLIIQIDGEVHELKNNQPCKAEVTDKTKIIELL